MGGIALENWRLMRPYKGKWEADRCDDTGYPVLHKNDVFPRT
jgi:hypothetical protein